MDLYSAQTWARNKMLEHGLIQNGWQFKFDNSVRRFGVCKYHAKEISLSKHLVRLNSEEQVKDTILHEIAHALVPAKHGHDAVWKAKCVEIGARPVRCYSSTKVTQPMMKYVAKCETCGREYQKQRQPRQGRFYSCHCQGGLPFSMKSKLVWKERNLVRI